MGRAEEVSAAKRLAAGLVRTNRELFDSFPVNGRPLSYMDHEEFKNRDELIELVDGVLERPRGGI